MRVMQFESMDLLTAAVCIFRGFLIALLSGVRIKVKLLHLLLCSFVLPFAVEYTYNMFLGNHGSIFNSSSFGFPRW